MIDAVTGVPPRGGEYLRRTLDAEQYGYPNIAVTNEGVVGNQVVTPHLAYCLQYTTGGGSEVGGRSKQSWISRIVPDCEWISGGNSGGTKLILDTLKAKDYVKLRKAIKVQLKLHRSAPVPPKEIPSLVVDREKAEQCPLCDSCFNRVSDCNRHLRVAHAGATQRLPEEAQHRVLPTKEALASLKDNAGLIHCLDPMCSRSFRVAGWCRRHLAMAHGYVEESAANPNEVLRSAQESEIRSQELPIDL
ncbi:hypothetical protein FOZ63_028659 [Perkinsus olseni]|uniref:C2H2-type domain-containing protein n=1 Tax=Perkinsus olseni TaxID=32597 RepID=A0A7J6UKD8_PEROL|nr:hypothetical protein FOZ63_028659 [Perkinsus olseni]